MWEKPKEVGTANLVTTTLFTPRGKVFKKIDTTRPQLDPDSTLDISKVTIGW